MFQDSKNKAADDAEMAKMHVKQAEQNVPDERKHSKNIHLISS